MTSMASSLADFICTEGEHYQVADEWCKKVRGRYPGKRFNFERVLDPSNYERFVESVVGDLTDDQMSVDGEVFEYCGNEDALDISRGRKEIRLQERSRKRVLFVPSKGRWHRDVRTDLLWEDRVTTKILLVPFEERRDYSKRFGEDGWLVISPVHDPHGTIGHARACILKLARFWNLPQIWVMDDSVPTSQFKETSFTRTDQGRYERTPQCDNVVPFITTLERIEMAMASMNEPVRDNRDDHSEKHREAPVCMIGPTSTRSVKTVEDAKEQINHRAPTSIVLLDLSGIPEKLTYDSRLPFKEDIIFAGRLVQANLNVVVYRKLHFIDIYMSTGGCCEHKQAMDQ